MQLRWSDTSSAEPAADVLVRLVALTDNAYDEGRLDAFLMDRVSPREWVWTAELPDDLRTTYQFCPVRDHPIRGVRIDEQRWQSVIALGVPDPRADDQLPPGCVFGAVDKAASVLSMPGAPPQPLVGTADSSSAELLDRHELDDGSVVSVQRPHASNGPSALAVLFDGRPMLTIGVPAIVRTLQSDGVVGPVTTAFVESIRGSATRGPSRVQSLTDRSQLGRFVVETLMPLLERDHDLDPRPNRRVVAGHSLGGLAALHVATSRPDLFGSAVLGSAALWWPGNETQLSGAEVAAAAIDHPRRESGWSWAPRRTGT